MLTKDDLILGLEMLKESKKGLTHAQIAKKYNVRQSKVSNKIATACRYKELFGTPFWNAFEKAGTDPTNIMVIFVYLRTWAQYKQGNFFKNKHINAIKRRMYLDQEKTTKEDSSSLLLFIRSLSDAELHSLYSVYQIREKRYNQIKKVHDLKDISLGDNAA